MTRHKILARIIRRVRKARCGSIIIMTLWR